MARWTCGSCMFPCIGKGNHRLRSDGAVCETEEPSQEELLRQHLPVLVEVKKPPRVTLEEMVKRSEEFPQPFPIDTARLSTLLKAGHDKAALEEQINSAYPLVHERVLLMLSAFLSHKQVHGNKIERKVFRSLDLLGLVERLLKKRPLVFVGSHDMYLLRNGKEGLGGWEDIGTSSEEGSLTIAEYMSYDEMKLSALMCVSSHSVFINDGNRKNCGVPGDPGTFQPEGIIVGMVGARMHRRGVMEYQDCVITPKQNTRIHGYGKDIPPYLGLQREWGQFWGKKLPTWDQAKSAPEGTYIVMLPDMLFNAEVYKARIQLSAETLLTEAGARAEAVGLQAYVNVVGLGLGEWRLFEYQGKFFVEAWGDALKVSDTSFISHVDFSWVKEQNCQGVYDGEVFPSTNVKLHFSCRALHAPVPPGNLLVTSFAWDGNSMPGNEYWMGSLSSSGDPAAACSSGVAQLHNALINPCITATNLHVASTCGVEHISKYAQRKNLR